MGNTFKSIVIYCSFILLLMLTYLLTFDLTKENEQGNWITVVNIGTHISFPLNNDSYDQIHLTQNPKDVIGGYRQSRPFAFYIIGYPYKFGMWLYNGLSTLTPKMGISLPPKEALPHFHIILFIYILFNIILLILTALLVEKLITPFVAAEKHAYINYILILLVISDRILRPMIFSAVYQIFHILIPILAVVYISKLYKEDIINKPQIRTIAISLGIFSLIYAGFYPIIIAFLIALFLYLAAKESTWEVKSYRLFGEALIYTLVPTLIWLQVINIWGVESSVDEMKTWRMFIWILDEFNDNGLLGAIFAMGNKLKSFLNFLLFESIYPLCCIVIMTLILRLNNFSWKKLFADRNFRILAFSILIVYLSLMTFWYLGGLYIWRYFRPMAVLLMLFFIISFLCFKKQLIEKTPNQKITLSLTPITLLTLHLIHLIFFPYPELC